MGYNSRVRRPTIDAFVGAEGKTKDYYEVLQVSRNAHPLMLTKAYRLFAALYHPDNRDTGDKNEFLSVVEAYRVLSDPVRRAMYDREMFGITRTEVYPSQNGTSSARADRSVENESQLRQSLLHALYTVRRNRPQNPGLSLTTLAELLGCSIDLMQFTLWYLRGKKLIDTVDDGDVAITVLGVDHIEANGAHPGRPEGVPSMQSHRPLIELPCDNGGSTNGIAGAS